MSDTAKQLTDLKERLRAAEVQVANIQARKEAAQETIQQVIKELEDLGLAESGAVSLQDRLDGYLRDIAEVLAEATERIEKAQRILDAERD